MINKPQQWFFLALIALWLILSLLAPLLAFISTGNLLCLTAFADIAPPTYLLYFLAKRIFPPGDSETKIELANYIKKEIRLYSWVSLRLFSLRQTYMYDCHNVLPLTDL